MPVLIGLQSRYYSADATAALQYEAEALTPLGTSSKVAGAAGASGSGSNVVRNTDLIPTYQAILKSEIDATNAALTHVGSFRIWARIFRPIGNTGAVSVRLEWGQGDFRKVTLNDPVGFAADAYEGYWTLIDLGLVHLTAPAQGAHRWEFRVLAKSTVTGDEIDVDHFCLFPTAPERNYIELSGRLKFETSSSFSARDEFDQVVSGGSDPLTGKTAPVGGVWAGAGDADDFVVEDTGHTAQRTAVSDSGGLFPTGGRTAISGVAAMTATVVQVDFKWSALNSALLSAVIARYVDTDDHLAAYVVASSTNPRVNIEQFVAGASTVIGSAAVPFLFTVGQWYTLRLQVDTGGRVALWIFAQGASAGSPLLLAQSPTLATGGTLDDGKPGFADWYRQAPAITRNYDNFLAFVPTSDAAIFAGQSLELRHDGADREDSTGTFWQPVSSRRGHYLKIPAAGMEGRTSRIIVKGVRGPTVAPGVILDPAIDDIQAQLFATPRGLNVPAP